MPAYRALDRGFFHRRLIAPIVALLTQGITPEKIALSLAFGIGLGVFPVLGSSTILCAVAALILGLNMPAIQLVNYVIYPLQLIFMLPFIRLGEILFRAAPLQLSLTQMLAIARENQPRAFATLWLAGVHAATAWLLIGPLLIFLLYLALSRLLRHVADANGLHQPRS
jgi:uncharacterized protein (DUF2062 family)